MSKNKVVAFIPVRGGSKSIPLKNIKKIAGKPLVQWVLEAASRADCIDEVFVASDYKEISSIVEDMKLDKVKVIGRSPETATDTASSESALLEFCSAYDFGSVFFIQATSPLLTSEDIDSAWSTFQSSDYKSLLSVVRQKRFVWEETDGAFAPTNYVLNERPRRQDFNGYYVENGAFYLSSRLDALTNGCRLTQPVGLYEMPEESYFELDEPSDWPIMESLLRRNHDKISRAGKARVKMFVMDCDGVLTDAGMYYSESGEALKKFNTRDGKGVELLRDAGILTAILTGEESKSVMKRAEKLKVDELVLNSQTKDIDLKKIAAKHKLNLSEVAYIGDDINDLPAIELCGLTACPSDASPCVLEAVDVVLDCKGGHGAVRAFADLILS
jgi:N-acylneuraminate cytidylyltransferase